MLRLFECFERNIHFQFPRKKFGGVRTSAGIMFRETLLQIRRMPDITIRRIVNAFDEIGIKHCVVVLDGLPFVARNRCEPSSFAKAMEDTILRSEPPESVPSATPIIGLACHP